MKSITIPQTEKLIPEFDVLPAPLYKQGGRRKGSKKKDECPFEALGVLGDYIRITVGRGTDDCHNEIVNITNRGLITHESRNTDVYFEII